MPNDIGVEPLPHHQTQVRYDIYDSIKHRLIDDEASRKVRELVKTAPIPDLRHRIVAANVLADDYSHDPHAKDQSFRSWLASIYSTKDLQDRAAGVPHNRKLRSMTPAELRAQAAAARQQPQKYEYPQLPPEYYDGYKVVASSAPQIKELLRRFGREQVDAAINRYKTLQTSYDQGDSYTRF